MHFTDFIISPPVIGHRGASAYAPENTLASFIKAKELGVNWVEFDVMLTACGEAIVIHDERLERTSNGNGRVMDCTYSDLMKLDAGSWFHPHYKDEKIPTLKEVLVCLDQYDLLANIEIKPPLGQEEKTAQKALEIICSHWKNKKQPPLLSSFSLKTLEHLRGLSSHVLLGYLMDEWNENWNEICDRLHCVSVHCNEKILSPERIIAIQSTDRKVFAYTVNQVDRAKELFFYGIDAIFSDCPDKILNFL